MKNKTIKRTSSKKSEPDKKDILIYLKNLDATAFEAKFDKMLDDMNITNTENRTLISSKDYESKLQMLCGYLRTKDSDTIKSYKKSYHPKEIIQEILKSDATPDHTLDSLQGLRVYVSTNPISQIQELVVSSLRAIKSIMIGRISALQTHNLIDVKILHECVRCTKCLMDCQKGVDIVIGDKEYVELLVTCSHPHHALLMTDAVRLLAGMSLINFNSTVQGVTQVARRQDVPRFQRIVDALNSSNSNLIISGLMFVNAILSGHADIRVKGFIQFEFNRCGLTEALKHLRTLNHALIARHIEVYDSSLEDDLAELQSNFEMLELYFPTPEEAANVLIQMARDSPIQSTLLSIFHLLLFIDGDIGKKRCYFQFIEEFLVQVLLQKDGHDYEFNQKVFDLNLSRIFEGMANKQDCQDLIVRLELIEQKYSTEVTAKNELEAKLNIFTKNSEAKLKTAEEEGEKLKLENSAARAKIAKLEADLKNMEIKLSQSIAFEKTASRSSIVKQSSSTITNISPPPPGFDDGCPPPPPPPGFDDGCPPPPPPPGFDDGCPPPPPPPGFDDGCPPPPPGFGGGPPPPPGFGGMVKKSAPSKPKYKPKKVTKRLNWTKINYSNIDENCIWKDMNESTYADDETFDRIVELFAARSSNGKPSTSTTGNSETVRKKIKEPIVLDPKSNQNIGIFLGGIKCSYNELVKRILQCNQETVTETFLESLIKYLPPTEQLTTLSEYDGDIDELVEAEQFLKEIIIIKDLDERLSYLLITRRFEEQLSDIKPQISCVISACQEIKQCQKLKEIFKIVLLTGNYMNSGSRNECSFGFEFPFLTSLSDTKGENGITLMHFLAEFIEKKHSHLLTFDNELTNVPLASKVNEDIVTKAVSQISKNVTQLQGVLSKFDIPLNCDDKFGEIMRTFYERASEQCIILMEMLEKMNSEYSSICALFSIKTKMPFEELFGILCKLIEDFVKAYNDNKRKAQKAEKDRAANERKIQENAKKEQFKKSVTPKKTGDCNDSSTPKDGMMDGLLQALESGQVFQQNKGVNRRPKPKNESKLFGDRKRTMNLENSEIYKQFVQQQTDIPSSSAVTEETML